MNHMNKKIPSVSSIKGFTLMEVIVVLSVIAILAALAFPAFRGITRSSQVSSAANDFVSAMNLARSEAVTRGVPVTVCKSADQATCVTGGNWDVGWIVFVDEDADNAVDGEDEILRVYTPQGSNVEMIGDPDNPDNPDSMTYLATGFLDSSAEAAILEVNAEGKQVKVYISASGRVSAD